MNFKRILFLALVLIILFLLPFSIYGQNSRFDISSILLYVRYDISSASVLVQFIPNPLIVLPSLLICIPCLLWLYTVKEMRVQTLVGSAGLVVFVLTAILLIFLPIGYVLPWFYQGWVLAVIPEFSELIPFSGLVFTITILLPLIWRGLIYPQAKGETLKLKTAALALSLIILLSPLIIETFSLNVTNPTPYYHEGFYLHAIIWNIWYTVDGNIWGYNAMSSFSIPSIHLILAQTILILPGIIFAWFVCRPPYNRSRLTSMITAGLIHLLIVLIASIWISSINSLPRWWIVTPLPTLFVGGLMIAVVHAGYQWIRKRPTSTANNIPEIPIQPQM